MTDLEQILIAGTLLIIETGEYSDKSWGGPVRIVRDFSKAEVAGRFRAEWVRPGGDDYSRGPEPYAFLPWLIKEGYVEDVAAVHAWHVGSYGDFEP